MHTRYWSGFTSTLVALSVGASPVLSSSGSSAAGDAPAPGTLVIVAGTGAKGFSGDGGPATEARLDGPTGVAFDAAGHLFVTDMENRRVRKVTPEGMISTMAGGGDTLPPSVDGIPAAEARLYPNMPTFDGAGNLFLAGYFANRVWKVSPQGWVITLAQMQRPLAVAADVSGNLFISDLENNRVLKLTPEGDISTVAGGGAKSPRAADGGPATEARLNFPACLAVDRAGNLFIAEPNNNRRVRKVSPDGIITTVAGGGTKPPQLADGGPATEARLTAPFGLAVDSAGNLFIADREDYRVRKVTPEGIISTVAGTGRPQFSGASGPATAAGLRGPHGLAVDAAGNLYIADTAWLDHFYRRNSVPAREHVLKVVGVAAPGLIAGRPFPNP